MPNKSIILWALLFRKGLRRLTADKKHAYFSRRECEYFPCHDDVAEEEFNCLFCYCPMNSLENCLGRPVYFKNKEGKLMKDCTGCSYPHDPAHYDAIMEFLKKNPPSVKREGNV